MTDTPIRQDASAMSDFAVGVVALVIGLAALLFIPSQVSSTAFQSPGNVRSPAFFPILASSLLVIFAMALLVRSTRAGPRAGDAPRSGRVRPHPRVALVAGILLAAGIAVNLLGFLATACALIIGLSAAFGARRGGAVLVLSLAVPAGIHLLFRSVLNVLLPGGVLF